MAWPIFFVAAVAIYFAGNTLARTGDVIARQTRLGHLWVGALLIAGATSLPELTAGTTAVLTDAPDLAVGGTFGSNMANMAILAFVALWFGRARVLQREALGITLMAALALVLTGIASLFIVARLEYDIAGVVGFGSIVLVAAVVVGLLLVPRTAESAGEPEQEQAEQAAQSTAAAGVMFCAAAAVIFVAAPVLVWAAEEITKTTGLAESFVGVLMLAIATSLPELAASSAAVRMGSLDLAVGNLYGSNAMNMGTLIWLDVLYTKAPLLETVDISNAVAGLVAVLLMMIGLTDMVLRAERRRFPFDPAAALILIGYALGLLLTWSVSST